jgi:hypothetical protein
LSLTAPPQMHKYPNCWLCRAGLVLPSLVRLSFPMQPQKSLGPRARSTTMKRAKKVSPNPIDPERSRTPSAWRRSDCYDGWMGRKCFSYHRGEGKSGAGDRHAMWPELQPRALLCCQRYKSTSCKPHPRKLARRVSALLPCAFPCSHSPSSSRPCNKPPEKNKMRRSCSPLRRQHLARSTRVSPIPLLLLCPRQTPCAQDPPLRR